MLAVLGLLLALAAAVRPGAQAAPAAVTWPTIHLTAIKSGFTSPVHVTNAHDTSNRLFVVEQRGQIKILLNGNTLATPFLNISDDDSGADRVRTSGNEEGLLSVAFPPDFPGAGKDHFYVYYTSKVSGMNGDNVVARYYLDSANVADPDSEEIILHLAHPNQENHNGGQLMFGPDGYLYVSTGGGGGGGDPYENAQDLDKYLGKILRLDVETGSPSTYTVPADNPFVDEDGLDEIWAYGLRNPWRFSFDRLTHDIFIGDVGQGSWEEIDYQPAASDGGENYGWDCYEGDAEYELTDCGPPGNYVSPVTAYSHSAGCSVTGGYVYRGSAHPDMRGVYFYADYCSGVVWGLQPDGGGWANLLLENFSDFSFTTFGEDEAGELYAAFRGGTVYRVDSDDWAVYLPLILKD